MEGSTTARLPAVAWAMIALLCLGGLVLRIAAAQGGLWTDEAWSVIYVSEARDAAGVFLRINHDNNHHLNSLWLLLVGATADPLLARALSIAAGTASIAVAGLIGARRGPAQAIAAAALFAFAPFMVNYGAEARGYALLELAILLAILLVDSWLARPEAKPPIVRLALLSLFGMLAHLTMIAAISILALWAFLVIRKAEGPDPALRQTFRLFAPAMLAAAMVILMVVVAARHSETGMRVGGYTPFGAEIFFAGLGEAVTYSLGFVLNPPWLGPLLVAAMVILIRPQPDPTGRQYLFYLLSILAIPALVLLLHPGNSEFPRYYQLSVIGLLLFASELFARNFDARGWRRWASVALILVVLAASLVRDVGLIRARRGDPDGPIRILANRSPSGARVALGIYRLDAVMRVAAARMHYPLALAANCAPADYFLDERASGAPLVPERDYCGSRMMAIATVDADGLSGSGWTLYAVRPLQ